jgi:hypothetical protein
MHVLAGGVKKAIIKKRSAYDVKLIAPDDDFMLLADYKKEFGSPSAKENRDRKHRKITFNGVSGVAMPGTGLWKLRREHVNSAIKDDVYEDGSASDGVASGQADEKFEDIVEEK